MRVVLWLLAKDLRLEWRTREIVTSTSLLAALLVMVFGAMRSDAAAAPAAMWVTYAFGAALGFGRTFAVEHDDLIALRLAPIDRGAIYLAKAIANWLALTVVQLVSLPLFGAMFTERVWTALPALALPLVLGGLGLAAAGTLFAALLSQTRLREGLLPILMLPVALPAVAAAFSATAGILDGTPLSAIGTQLQLLGVFDIVMMTASLLLFDVFIEG